MKRQQNEITFIGKPFADQLMDEQKTFNGCNLEMEQDQVFQSFLATNQLQNYRSSMIVFGPENFMYWYGVVVPNKVEVPTGLMKFVLPKALVAVEEEPQTMTFFSQPLNQVVPKMLGKVRAEGIQTYENPGDSLTPYLVQNLNLETKKLTQMLYLEVSN